ncbi:MAG TPA: glutamate mutase L [Planctomycetota bacterium]|nr:glutamate mutase L [Planctomycetota bacterium]
MTSRRAEIITVEVGSTITKALAFGDGKILGRATALTTPADVSLGLREAGERLKASCGLALDDAARVYATSSAAGGLRMTVHGLTRDLTTRAAEEAALGAGANVKLVTAGRLGERQLKKLAAIKPNLVMLAGGVEDGEEETVLANAKAVAGLGLDCPTIFAGNAALQDDVRAAFAAAGRDVKMVENVYPRFDELNVEPARAVIQRIFAERLVIAPGMEELRKLAGGRVSPVPAAVLRAAELLSAKVGDLVVLDVGGATTDVHSVVRSPSPGNLDAQVVSRRTVEGDLGVFASAESAWAAMGRKGKPKPLAALPSSAAEQALSRDLAAACTELGLLRHAGRVIPGAVLPDGRVPVRGRDLRSVRLVVGSGGALAALGGGLERLESALRSHRREALLPPADAELRIDRDYVFAACGAFAADFPELAVELMLRSVGR